MFSYKIVSIIIRINSLRKSLDSLGDEKNDHINTTFQVAHTTFVRINSDSDYMGKKVKMLKKKEGISAYNLSNVGAIQIPLFNFYLNLSIHK